jgi:hypothetical protein
LSITENLTHQDEEGKRLELKYTFSFKSVRNFGGKDLVNSRPSDYTVKTIKEMVQAGVKASFSFVRNTLAGRQRTGQLYQSVYTTQPKRFKNGYIGAWINYSGTRREASKKYPYMGRFGKTNGFIAAMVNYGIAGRTRYDRSRPISRAFNSASTLISESMKKVYEEKMNVPELIMYGFSNDIKS